MKTNKRNWKLERASVHHKSAARSKSNKYSKSDNEDHPQPHSRMKVWVGAYTRRDGRKVEGHFRYPKMVSH